ncbi:hypothetical protein C0992_010149 [Termitomyces sp. T32_za158]|nr:hypothetical protein C0992_010149 [Termitomyces sp. T32_za158]
MIGPDDLPVVRDGCVGSVDPVEGLVEVVEEFMDDVPDVEKGRDEVFVGGMNDEELVCGDALAKVLDALLLSGDVGGAPEGPVKIINEVMLNTKDNDGLMLDELEVLVGPGPRKSDETCESLKLTLSNN